LKIFYLTYNEAPSSVFSSQVIDVVRFLNSNGDKAVTLVSFISLRNFFRNRKAIKKQLATALVVPMFPRMSNWKYNRWLLLLLSFIFKSHTVIARSVMATKLALAARDRGYCKKVVYDARGAIACEWTEYKVVTNKFLLGKIEEYEKEVIHRSDFRLSVSQKLVDFWKVHYGFDSEAYVVIPCTLQLYFLTIDISDESILKARKQLGLLPDDVVYVYSGSLAGWQSFELTQTFIEPILKKNPKNKIVFFSHAHDTISDMALKFPDQVLAKRLESDEVQHYLIAGDYGLLIREDSKTNQVASPIKYAEYLACGLKVILSDHLGDYTALSLQHKWGFVYSQFDSEIEKPDLTEKTRISLEGIKMFSKSHYTESYNKLFYHFN